MKYTTQNIKAKHLRARYKVSAKNCKVIRIKLIKHTGNTYLIVFDNGAETILEENETLPITFLIY